MRPRGTAKGLISPFSEVREKRLTAPAPSCPNSAGAPSLSPRNRTATTRSPPARALSTASNPATLRISGCSPSSFTLSHLPALGS